MKRNSFTYAIGAEVVFTREECELLIELAKHHYDAVCIQAGLQIGESSNGVVGRVNGFLAQLKMFEGPVAWPFHNLDITAKILEQRRLLPAMRSSCSIKLADQLNKQINQVMDDIQKEYLRVRS